ncbi:SURF1 family protein [Tessaracoccus antarcticus]|uniref:SURF1-like protein n=1 Tax=Tessaracoccus antarcticus TaxID=2479848 RepID=A0A3M0GVY0_9ACTN|nr:SURF1 family protein [Tessaracoccus antarcticus]RMB61496.1 SURF1 family protein [Tessaracoccus antarcticus]
MSLTFRRGLTILIGVIVAVVMLVMGLWQMARFQASIVDVAAERAAQSPVPLSESIAADGTIDDIYGRRVQLSGEVVPGYELLVGSQWPMRVVVPFEMTDGRIVPVVLGLGDREVNIADAGPTSIEGIFTAGDQEGESTPPADAPAGSTATLRLQGLVQQWPQPMVAGYVTLDADAAAQYSLEPASAALPEVQGSAMHQGYALQWWVFAAASIAFSIVVARGLKPRLD